MFAETRAAAPAFARAVFEAYWVDSQDISDLDTLARLAVLVGLDGGAVRAAAEDPFWKAGLEANNREAAGRGVFGVPMVDVGHKLYFGNDRLGLLELHLGGSAPRACDPRPREVNGRKMPTR